MTKFLKIPDTSLPFTKLQTSGSNTDIIFLNEMIASIDKTMRIKSGSWLLEKFGSKYSLLLFIFSLLLFTSVSILLRFYMNNSDEYDHLTSGFFMQNGKMLYKDFFSHHFPFPYYWTYLFTPLWSTSSFTRTITIFRLEVLVLYLITFVSVYYLVKKEITRYAFSLWIILLSTFFVFYHGNLVLSETFSAIFISGLFWIATPIIVGWERPTKQNLVFILICASAAVWTQPLLLPLMVIPFLLTKEKSQLKLLSVLAFLFNIIPLALFFLTNQLTFFFDEAIWFNFFIYPKYYVTLPGGNMNINPLLHFLQNEGYLVTRFFTYIDFFQFAVHLAYIILLILILKSKRWRNITIFLLILLAVRSREVKIFAGSIFNFAIFPFLVIATGALCILVAMNFKKHRVITTAIFLILLVVNCLLLAPTVTSSLNSQASYLIYWSQRQELGNTIQKLSKPDDKILAYPNDVDLYFFAQRFPPDRFTYWYPWINAVEKYHEERLRSLKISRPRVIYIGSLSFKNDTNYYMKYFPELLNNYVPVKENNELTGIWIEQKNIK